MFKVFTTFYGKKKLIDESRIVKRSSSYAVVIHDEKILLISNKNTNKWWFPGGVLEKNESVESAAIRETNEETGIKVELIEKAAEVESFFYYDHADAPYHQYSTFFLAKPLNYEPTSQNNPDASDEATGPEWVEIFKLKEEDFQDYGWEVIQLFKASFM